MEEHKKQETDTLNFIRTIKLSDMPYNINLNLGGNSIAYSSISSTNNRWKELTRNQDA